MGLIGASNLGGGANLPFRHLAFFKPYIELFTDYLQKHHMEEI